MPMTLSSPAFATGAGIPDRYTFLRDYGGHAVEQSRLVGIYER
ncbi:hypothetical protein [Thiohalocapsa sp.]|nr:hypothetical protein [Thiohalocapsa sp.]